MEAMHFQTDYRIRFTTMVRFLLCCVLVASVGYAVVDAKIPDYIQICHRSDPRVASCIKKSVEALRPKLKKGIPELGVPGLDPLHLDKIVIFDGVDNPGLKAHLENIEATGAGDFEILKLKLDVEKMTYRVGVKIPFIRMEGEYNVDAKILSTPFVGKGKFHANTTDIEGHAIIQGAVENGRLKFKAINFKILLKDFNLHMENLGGSNQVLSQAANEILSTNKEDLIRIATPFIERKCSEVMLEMSNKITDNLLYDEAFPL